MLPHWVYRYVTDADTGNEPGTLLIDAVLAGQEGIEPPTFGFGDRRSAN